MTNCHDVELDGILKPYKSLHCTWCGRKSFDIQFDEAKAALQAYVQQEVRKGREIFVPVRGAEGSYEVSNTGKVRSVLGGRRKGIELKQSLRNKGPKAHYLVVSLVKDGKVMSALVHRLVASAFISNPENKRCVNHKDSNKLNNNVENLEWSTHQENELHSYQNGKAVWNKGRMGVPAHWTRLAALNSPQDTEANHD